MPPKKVKTLRDLLASERKSKLVYSGAELKELKSERLPTGIFILDLLTGGGIPLGKTSQYWGAKSCGKSTLAARTTGAFLRTFKSQSALWIDFEQTYEEPWASNFIDDLDRLWVIQPDFAEQGIDIVKKACEAPELGLIIADSLAQMIPLYDAEISATKDSRAAQPKIINKLFRKVLPQMSVARRSGKSLTFIVINQLRSKMSSGPPSKFGTPVGKSGGFMQEHVPSLELRLYFIRYNNRDQAEYQFVVEKNKVGGRAKKLGTFNMNRSDGSIDDAAVVAAYARRFGLIRQVGKSWVIDGTTRVCKLIEDTVRVVEEEPKIRKTLVTKMLARVSGDMKTIIPDESGSSEEEGEEQAGTEVEE